ncbi:MAG: PLP-dependent aminotransferase family protein [Anaerolineales bacterium]|nr:PLP-dependent aminotransferase family protein [Anaerolineales bacterium]
MTDLSITQIDLPPSMIDLGMGDPDLDLLPLEALRRSAESFFTACDPRPLQYGAEQGDGYFRRALADFLARAYGASVHPASLFVAAGASSALDLLCTLYTRPGELVFVEEPSYFLALRIFADHGLKVVSLPIDDDGLILEALDEKLAEQRPAFVYTIPTFQNPSGRTLSQARREKLVELAQRHNFLLLADEVYHFLSYGQPPPAPFAAFAEQAQQVVSLNSFSKILAPGLRLGWIQAHRSVIQRLASSGLLDSGGGMNPFTSALVRNLVESGDLESNIGRLRAEYARRRDALGAALRQHLPQAEFTTPQGGFFFWARLHGVDAAELRRAARRFDVDIRQGALFSSQAGLRDYFRLSFSYYKAEAIAGGLERLGDCLSSFTPG